MAGNNTPEPHMHQAGVIRKIKSIHQTTQNSRWLSGDSYEMSRNEIPVFLGSYIRSEQANALSMTFVNSILAGSRKCA
jgi:hypothetical protein